MQKYKHWHGINRIRKTKYSFKNGIRNKQWYF